MPVSDCEKLAEGVEHGDVLVSFCKWALTSRERLPKLQVDEKIKRSAPGQYGSQPVETISMLAHYGDEMVRYSNLKMSGKTTKTPILEYELNNGFLSTGELRGALEAVLMDGRNTSFKFAKDQKRGQGKRVLVYDFKISPGDNTSWVLMGAARAVPGYKGKISLDGDTGQPTRLEWETTELVPTSPRMDFSEEIDYENIHVSENNELVLPVRAETRSSVTNDDEVTNSLTNEITFRNWRVEPK